MIIIYAVYGNEQIYWGVGGGLGEGWGSVGGVLGEGWGRVGGGLGGLVWLGEIGGGGVRGKL